LGRGGPGDINELPFTVGGNVALVTWPESIDLRAIDISRKGCREGCVEEDGEGKHMPRANTEIHDAVFTANSATVRDPRTSKSETHENTQAAEGYGSRGGRGLLSSNMVEGFDG